MRSAQASRKLCGIQVQIFAAGASRDKWSSWISRESSSLKGKSDTIFNLRMSSTVNPEAKRFRFEL